MSDDEQYGASLERCEAAARNNGHLLGVWHAVSEYLHASLCEVCGAMVWVVRPDYQKRWRGGGTALKQGCLLRRRTDTGSRSWLRESKAVDS